MLKEQIEELFLQYRQDLCDTEFAPEPFEQTTDIDLHNRYARKVLALFPQGEGGVLCDDGICKAVCKERTRYCAFALKSIDMPCEWYDQYKRVAQAQHALDNQSKQAALKEQMKRVMGKITSRILELSVADYVSGGMAELQALKAELEGE